MPAAGKPRVIPWPTVPANDATIVMFATHDRKAGGSGVLFQGMKGVRGLHYTHISAYEATWYQHNKASAANGIRVYARDVDGTWREVDIKGVDGSTAGLPVQIAANSAGAESHILVDVSRYLYGWAIEYVTGADNPENWSGSHGVWINSGRIAR